MKTLAFLRWLGVDVPRWIENDLRHAADPLKPPTSRRSRQPPNYRVLRALDVPFGINVESVSIRRVEIEASVRLAERSERSSGARTGSRRFGGAPGSSNSEAPVGATTPDAL